MNIQQAINSGKKFKRCSQIYWMYTKPRYTGKRMIYFTDNHDEIEYVLCANDVLAEDWEVKSSVKDEAIEKAYNKLVNSSVLEREKIKTVLSDLYNDAESQVE